MCEGGGEGGCVLSGLLSRPCLMMVSTRCGGVEEEGGM